MPDAQTQFQLLAAEFEMLSAEMRVCKNPERRHALLQGMKILIDEIFGLVSRSLPEDHEQTRLSHSKRRAQASAT
jgi:hypothetical protein